RQWGVGFRLNFQSPKKKNRTNAEIDPHRPQKQNPYRRSRMQILVKRTFGLILAAACACAAAHAQSVTQADRDKALAYLESTRQGVVDATQGLSPAQWNFKPAPDRWSVAEVTEHIAAAEDYIRG